MLGSEYGDMLLRTRLFMKKFYALFSMFCIFSSDVLADEFIVMTDQISFGDIIQTNRDSSVISMSHSGVRTMVGATSSKNYGTSSGEIFFENTDPINKTITIMPISDIDVPGCSATLSNFVVSSNTFQVSEEGKSSINVGATLTIKGFCHAGTYTGNAVINYQVENNDKVSHETANLPFVFGIEIPLGLAKQADLNFGSYLSPQKDEVITITQKGVNTGNLTHVPGSNPHVGVMLATGVSGKSANVELSKTEVELKNGKNTLLAELNISPSSFVFGGNEQIDSPQNIIVGGKIYVKANQATGRYTDTVYVTIFYND